MNITTLVNEVLDRAKAQRGITSDAILADELGTSYQTIWRWRRGEFSTKTIKLMLLLAEQRANDSTQTAA